MKRILTLIMAVLLFAGAIEARTYALVVGISNYHDPQNDVQWTTASAKRFAKMLQQHTKDVSIVTGKHATHDNILGKLQAICKRAQPDDRIIFFYSGHGLPGGICPVDGLLSYDEICNALAKSRAKNKFCFIEACHSGSVKESSPNAKAIQRHADRGNVAFFVGCRPEESSIVLGTIGAGAFSQALITGLRGKSDYNGDKAITVMELFKYAYNDVLHRLGGKQHPQLICPKSMHDTPVIRW